MSRAPQGQLRSGGVSLPPPAGDLACSTAPAPCSACTGVGGQGLAASRSPTHDLGPSPSPCPAAPAARLPAGTAATVNYAPCVANASGGPKPPRPPTPAAALAAEPRHPTLPKPRTPSHPLSACLGLVIKVCYVCLRSPRYLVAGFLAERSVGGAQRRDSDPDSKCSTQQEAPLWLRFALYAALDACPGVCFMPRRLQGRYLSWRARPLPPPFLPWLAPDRPKRGKGEEEEGRGGGERGEVRLWGTGSS